MSSPVTTRSGRREVKDSSSKAKNSRPANPASGQGNVESIVNDGASGSGISNYQVQPPPRGAGGKRGRGKRASNPTPRSNKKDIDSRRGRRKVAVRKKDRIVVFDPPSDLETIESWLLGDKPILDTVNDPWNLADAPGFCSFQGDTKKKYLGSWEEFLTKYDVKLGKPVTFGMAYQFIESKFFNNYSATTITSLYSHLQAGFTNIYNRSLGERKQILA